MATCVFSAASGSSPLARGLRHSCGTHSPCFRIIPARAGFTEHFDVMTGFAKDHPRSRGVYSLGATKADGETGSSPLARGLLDDSFSATVRARIIPARAGFTREVREMLEKLGDHPRSRGVYAVVEVRDEIAQGSSPLARGLRLRAIPRSLGFRIIPARAGFTPARETGASRLGDHPRSRGVYSRRLLDNHALAGSSPLARGLHECGAPHKRYRGIIPARAGFTYYRNPGMFAPQDHPRSRGVYYGAKRMAIKNAGSSPLARGLHCSGFAGAEYRGDHPRSRGVYGPASSWPGTCSTDHPRSRGVYSEVISKSSPVIGSSPLARGLRPTFPSISTRTRIIPARAGFTRWHNPRATPTADHPRSRGVYGSMLQFDPQSSRIIPARAGFTW